MNACMEADYTENIGYSEGFNLSSRTHRKLSTFNEEIGITMMKNSHHLP